MLKFSVIIVSWNALEHLKTFMPSVVEADYPDFEIILADNRSTDGSGEWVHSTFPEVKIVTFDRNYGYCGGNNRAVSHASGDILVFLNNDAAVAKDWLQHLEACFEADDGTAALQPKLRSWKQHEYFEYAGAAGGYLDQYGFPFCRGRLFDTVEKDEGQYDDPAELLWASGAALAVRRELFVELGGFDEDFEFHMEEIDFCWRLRNRGYRVGFCPDSVVYHLGGGSLPAESPRKTYYNFRNNLVMLWKNAASPGLLRRFLVRLLLDKIAFWRFLLTGKFAAGGAVAKAHLHFWLSWPKTHRKRRELEQARTVGTDSAILTPVNVVWQYFVRGRKTFTELDIHEDQKF